MKRGVRPRCSSAACTVNGWTMYMSPGSPMACTTDRPGAGVVDQGAHIGQVYRVRSQHPGHVMVRSRSDSRRCVVRTDLREQGEQQHRVRTAGHRPRPVGLGRIGVDVPPSIVVWPGDRETEPGCCRASPVAPSRRHRRRGRAPRPRPYYGRGHRTDPVRSGRMPSAPGASQPWGSSGDSPSCRHKAARAASATVRVAAARFWRSRRK